MVQGWGGIFPGGKTLFSTTCGWSTRATPSQYSPAQPDRTAAGLVCLLLVVPVEVLEAEAAPPLAEEEEEEDDGAGRSNEGTFLPNATAADDCGGGGGGDDEVAGEGPLVSINDAEEGKLTPYCWVIDCISAPT